HSPGLNDGPTVRNFSIENCVFKPNADFNVGSNARKYRIIVKGCGFENTGINIKNVTNIRLLNNTFYNTQGGSTPAIKTIDNVSGLGQSNVFSCYSSSNVIHSSGLPHQLQMDHNLF